MKLCVCIFLREIGSKLPSGVHELYEVVVVVDRGGYCCVVLVPLLAGEGAVLVRVAEVLQELHEDLVLSHLALLDLRMEFAVVHPSTNKMLVYLRSLASMAPVQSLSNFKNALSITAWRRALGFPRIATRNSSKSTHPSLFLSSASKRTVNSSFERST